MYKYTYTYIYTHTNKHMHVCSYVFISSPDTYKRLLILMHILFLSSFPFLFSFFASPFKAEFVCVCVGGGGCTLAFV